MNNQEHQAIYGRNMNNQYHQAILGLWIVIASFSFIVGCIVALICVLI